MTVEELNRYTQSFTSTSGESSSQRADSWRLKGNSQFKGQDYGSALECYNQSILCHPTVSAFANRAMVHLKLGMNEECIDDSSRALELDRNHVKSYLRRATAEHRVGRWVDAVEDFEEAIRREPSNVEAIEGRRACIAEFVEKTGTEFTEVPVPMRFEEDAPLIRPIQTQHYPGKLNSDPQTRPEEAKKKALPIVKERAADHPRTITVPQKIPKTSIEFEKSWRSCKGDSHKQAWILENIPRDAVPLLLKQCLSPKLLYQILHTILTHVLKSDCDQGIGLLSILPSTDRFSVNSMSLSKAQKGDITNAWNTAFDGEHESLRKHYQSVLLK